MDKNKIQKILVIRYRFVGDTILTTAFIRTVKENFPNTQIDVLVSPNSGELIENNPHVNKVIYFDTTDFHKYEEKRTQNRKEGLEIYYSLLSCALALRKGKYDLAFVLKRSFSSALLAFLAGARYRLGFSTELRSFLLTHKVKYNKNLNELDNFLNCLKPLGLKEVARYTPEIFPTKEEEKVARELLKDLAKNKPRILVHATSAHPYKEWPKSHFANLIDLMHKEFNAQFVFTGAGLDRQAYQDILSFCEHKKEIKFLNLCGLTSLRECFAIYKHLDLAVCVDSGNAHLAAASGIPTHVLYGPTDPSRWLPIGKSVFPVRLNELLDCQPCNLKVKCSHINCMKHLSPEYVFSKLRRNVPFCIGV